ncbi:cyclin-Q-like isoform X2 [Acropora palmata]|uniref:cyclin-Q-like isoform X2 n=1 Tax=Acropora palmata TaxID=6131 RepID=UPI003DA04819
MNELRPTECSPFRENLTVTKFIMDAGHRLMLTPVACASACVLYHRVIKKCNSKQSNFRLNDATLVGSTALYLASKMEECPCKLRDVINVSFRLLHKDKAPLDVGFLYWELRDSLVSCELMMLRSLQFDVTFNNPHKEKAVIILVSFILLLWVIGCDRAYFSLGLRGRPLRSDLFCYTFRTWHLLRITNQLFSKSPKFAVIRLTEQICNERVHWLLGFLL